MKTIQARTDIGLIMLIAGYLLFVAFGWLFGIPLAAIGFGMAAYSIVRGAGPGMLMLAALLAVSATSLWFMFSNNSGPREPPTLGSVVSFAEQYRSALATTDLEAYLDVAHPQLGLTLDEAFEVETQCLDWRLAQISVAPQEISPMFAVATFSAEGISVNRQFGYEFDSDRWTVQVAMDC